MSLERSSDIYLLAVGFLARGSGTPSERLISACEDFFDTLHRGNCPTSLCAVGTRHFSIVLGERTTNLSATRMRVF